MFAEMRRQDRKLTREEAEAILRDGQYGILSTTGENGYPYGVPVSYAYENGKIYFHGTCEGGLKTKNLQFNHKACFTVVGRTEVLPSQFGTKYESAVAFGVVKPADDKKEALMLLIRKYCADYLESGEKYVNAAEDKTAVWEFEIECLTGKARKK